VRPWGSLAALLQNMETNVTANRLNKILCMLVADCYQRHYRRGNDVWINELAEAADVMGLDPTTDMLLFMEIVAIQGRIDDQELKAAS
jgi:hypothetical protein